MAQKSFLILIVLNFFSCSSFVFKDHKSLDEDDLDRIITGYQPIDPIPIADRSQSVGELHKYPNETMRLAIGKITNTGRVSFTPVTTTKKDEQYIVILDYIKYKTDSVHVDLEFDSRSRENKKETQITFYIEGKKVAQFAERKSRRLPFFNFQNSPGEKQSADQASYSVPFYKGVGLRMISAITVRDTDVDIDSFYGLGVAASQNRVSGSLIIQTLGISGPEVSPLIPMPSKLNESTIQSAIQALAAIKAKLYENDTKINPQIVAISDPIGISSSTTHIETYLHRLVRQKNRKPQN